MELLELNPLQCLKFLPSFPSLTNPLQSWMSYIWLIRSFDKFPNFGNAYEDSHQQKAAYTLPILTKFLTGHAIIRVTRWMILNGKSTILLHKLHDYYLILRSRRYQNLGLILYRVKHSTTHVPFHNSQPTIVALEHCSAATSQKILEKQKWEFNTWC